MDASDVCPTEDAVQAFLDFLVDPKLPAKSSMRDTPSLEKQESVAKQVYAVVLLYNYYHRKKYPELEVLRFKSFCKLVVDLKPALLAHMKFMKSDSDLVDLEKQLSITERTIMDACELSTSLGASMGTPNIEEWPISKVAVLLVDSKKEKCFLQIGTSSNSMTEGVWSVIHKNVEVRDYSSDDARELKHGNKRTKVTGKPSRVESMIDDTSCQKLAYSAITEATGISQNDLLFLESYVVFSDSEKKAAALFYIVQCTKSGMRDIEFPIKDVIDRLQGPLVTKDSSAWTVTTVVEYFHVLPYAEILSDWFHRREFSNGSQVSRLGARNVIVHNPKRTETPCKPEIFKIQEKSHVNDVVIEDLGSNTRSSEPHSFKQKDSIGCCKIDLAHAFNGSQEVELEDSSMVASKKEKNCKKISRPIQVLSHHQDDMCSCIESEIPKIQDKLFHVNHTIIQDTGNNTSNSKPQPYKKKITTVYENTRQAEAFDGPQNLLMDDSLVPMQNVKSCKKSSSTIQVVNQQKKISLIGTELNGSVTNKVETVNRTSPSLTDCRVTKVARNRTGDINSSSQESKGGHTFATCQSNLKDSDKLQNTIASKEHILSQTALKVLMKKRNQLSLKKRNIEDELARCEKDIQTILNDSEDGSAVIVDSIIEGCSDGYLKNGRTPTVLEEEFSPKSIKRKRLSEAVLDKQDPCQALDDVCFKNSWVLPIYRVSPSDGGYQADVTVEGLDFKFSSDGDLCSSPIEARESAAFRMSLKLRSMAGQAKSQ